MNFQEKNKKTGKNHHWKELSGGRDEFQKIVKLLVDFDETTGRYRRYGDPEAHYMRRSISVADPETLRVFLQDLGGFIYYVVVELKTEGGAVSTSWIHEDGIRAERDEFSEEENHPVHSIVCMTDLYKNYSVKIPLDFHDIDVCDLTQEFLARERNPVELQG